MNAVKVYESELTAHAPDGWNTLSNQFWNWINLEKSCAFHLRPRRSHVNSKDNNSIATTTPFWAAAGRKRSS